MPLKGNSFNQDFFRDSCREGSDRPLVGTQAYTKLMTVSNTVEISPVEKIILPETCVKFILYNSFTMTRILRQPPPPPDTPAEAPPLVHVHTDCYSNSGTCSCPPYRL
jgi:hypothetical protein